MPYLCSLFTLVIEKPFYSKITFCSLISKNKKHEENWIVKNQRGEISFKFVQELRFSRSSCTLKGIDLAKREGIIEYVRN